MKKAQTQSLTEEPLNQKKPPKGPVAKSKIDTGIGPRR